MKLARIAKPPRSLQVRVTLAGDLNAALERYARYYEHVHGDVVDSKALIPEILSAFLQADREFQSWSRSGGDSHHSRPNSSSTQGEPSHRADSQQCQIRRRAPRVGFFDTSLIRE